MNKEIKGIGWERERRNIGEMAIQFPETLMDCLDAAYLAGLEAVRLIDKKKIKSEIARKIAYDLQDNFMINGSDLTWDQKTRNDDLNEMVGWIIENYDHEYIKENDKK